jgi:hypothetical protein
VCRAALRAIASYYTRADFDGNRFYQEQMAERREDEVDYDDYAVEIAEPEQPK